MKMIESTTAHPEEGDIVRYLDNELDAGEERSVREHLETCEACADRLGLIEELEDRLRARLAGDAVPVDEVARRRALAAMREAGQRAERASRTGDRRRMLAAAAVVVLLLGGLTVSPVRAWIAARLGVASAPTAAVETSDAAVRSVVSFQPTARIFRIELEHAQTTGSLVLSGGEGALASAEVADGADESLLVLPDGIRIANAAGSTASYHVRLAPGMVERVVVVAGGVPVAEVEAGAFAGAPLELDLRGATP